MDAEKSLAFKLPFKAIEAPGSGQEPSLIAHEPDIVVISLGEANLGWLQENPSVLPEGQNPARGGAGGSGAGHHVARCGPGAEPGREMPVRGSEREQRPDDLSPGAHRAYRDWDGRAEEGHEDLR